MGTEIAPNKPMAFDPLECRTQWRSAKRDDPDEGEEGGRGATAQQHGEREGGDPTPSEAETTTRANETDNGGDEEGGATPAPARAHIWGNRGGTTLARQQSGASRRRACAREAQWKCAAVASGDRNQNVTGADRRAGRAPAADAQ